MASERWGTWTERLEIAGDGALITAAMLAVLTAATLAIAQSFPGDVPVGIGIMTVLVTLLGGVAGPVLAWRMHGRRVTVPAVIGAFIGLPVTGAAFFLFVGLSAALGWIVKPVLDTEWAGALVAVIIVAVGFVVLVVWLAIDAVRDLSPDRSEHRRLDTVRLAAAFVVIAYSAAIAFLASRPEQGEYVEALAFMLMAGLAGASIVTMADVATRVLGRKPDEAAAAPDTLA